MSKMNYRGIPYYECDVDGCERSCDDTCSICHGDVCSNHSHWVYDKNRGDDYQITVCETCLNRDPDRFTEERPNILHYEKSIITKLKNKEQLNDEEMESLVEYLENR